MTSWHAASCKVLGMSRVIGIGPISYLGSCNFRKQCIVLWARNPSNWPPPTPPIRQTQLASFILGCILNRLRAIFRNMFSLFPLPLSLVFQSSAPRPCPLIADSDPKSPTLKLPQQKLLGIYEECIILEYMHSKMKKTYLENIYSIYRKHISFSMLDTPGHREPFAPAATQSSHLLHWEAPWVMGSRPRWLQMHWVTLNFCFSLNKTFHPSPQPAWHLISDRVASARRSERRCSQSPMFNFFTQSRENSIWVQKYSRWRWNKSKSWPL